MLWDFKPTFRILITPIKHVLVTIGIRFNFINIIKKILNLIFNTMNRLPMLYTK